MITLNIDYEVLPDRIVTIKLPETVRIGRHELLIVLDENEAVKSAADTNTKNLMKFSGAITSFKGVDGVEYQKKIRSEWS